MRPRRFAIMAAMVVLAACSPSVPSPSPSPPASTGVPTSDPSPSSSIDSTAAPRLPLADIPRLEIDPDQLTVLCDPEPTQAFAGGPESHLFCADVAALALGAFSLATADPIERIHLRRGVCVEGQPCPDDVVESGTVVGWSASASVAFDVDARETWISHPRSAPDAAWPSLPIQELEPARPLFEGAPDEVAARPPYPYCGRTRDGDQPRVENCFLAAVLAGQRAEMVLHAFGHDGGEIVSIYRFDGHGSVRALTRVVGEWRTAQGFIHLNPEGSGWSFEPWYGTDRVLALPTSPV